MQSIDRLYRFVTLSRRKVLIVLLIVSGSFLTFNYVVLSDNFTFSKPRVLSRLSNNGQTQSIETYHNSTTLLKRQEKASKVKDTLMSEYINSNATANAYHVHKSFKSTSTVSSPRIETRVAASIGSTNSSLLNSSTEEFNDNSFLSYEYEVNSDPAAEELNNSLNYFYAFPCKNVTMRRSRKRKKNLIVYENFIPAQRPTACHESITYTTHGDYRYLGNLIPLMERWNGPISVAVYSPGDDLQPTLKFISFLRQCASNKISEFVTFHIFFELAHSEIPSQPEYQFNWLDSLYTQEKWKDCTVKPRLKDYEPPFRIRKRLLYPVNIARNIARSAATTHYVLPSDIELYPSVNLIPTFFRMLNEQNIGFPSSSFPRVYVLPIFEVERGLKPPQTKRELVALLHNNRAVPFHNFICRECHLVPKYEEWKRETNRSGLHVFHAAKRKPPFQFWEPIYIGTKSEPPYDERLSWEGLRDKMTQGYILCALDYDFMVLDNAFLVHKPGIKRLSHKVTKTVLRQDRLIDLRIKSELFKRFGKQEGCVL